MSMTCQILPTTRLTSHNLQMTPANGLCVSKNIDLAAEYLQRDLDKLARWCAKWRIKLNPEKTKVIIFSKSRSAIRAEPALSLYGDFLSYYPHIKFLGTTIDNRMTFTEHFEEILERCNQKFHRLRILVNKKWSPSPETILQIYKQCVRPILEYGIVSTITVSETVITKIQRVQNSLIRLARRLPKYVSARLLHEASWLPYVRKRLITVGQNPLARMHANPFIEHTINSAKTNIAWDKYKTPISILKPPNWSTETDYKMQKNEVTSVNVQPLTLKVVVRPVHGHVWHSPRTQNQKPTRLPSSRFFYMPQASYNGWTIGKLTHYSTLPLTTTVYLQ